MLGAGGRCYWGRKGVQGVVVVFAWLSSQERHLKPYLDLYESFGWGSLVCHVEFRTLFFPEKAASLACSVLNELAQEVKVRPLPIVFSSFSGGSKGCMYKVLQLIEGKCQGQLSLEEYQLVRNCICGQMYDSSPVDFTSDLGTRFVLHPSVLKMSHPPRVVTWMAKAVASGLNTLFLDRFEEQRADFWQTLYSSVNMGPFLIFCSEDDELAPYQVICNFAQHLEELGGDVKLVKWNSSPHVAHYKHHQADYKASVSEFLNKSALVYSRRRELTKGTTGNGLGCNKISKSVCNLHKTAARSNESLRRVAHGSADHFFLPSSVEFHESNDEGAVQDMQKGALFQMQNAPRINAHGVLGQILFDVCVPKNVEDWDIKPVNSSTVIDRFASSHRDASFSRRARL